MTTFNQAKLAQASEVAAKNEAIGVPRPCFGVGCDRHGACASYWAVNGADPELPRIGTCGVGAERPMFVRLSERRTVR